jgi:primosomal protein N' (replication factor Y)
MNNDSQNQLFEMKIIRSVPVLVPMPVDRAFTYAVPEGKEVVPGSIVQVPLGPRKVIGIVWDGEVDQVDTSKLKTITEVFDCPPLQASMRRFIDWVANYTISPPGLVARMAIRAPAALDPEPMIPALKSTGLQTERITDARRRVLELVNDAGGQEGMAWTKSGLSHAAGVTGSVIDGLTKQGVFETVMLPAPPIVAKPDPSYGQAELSDEQSAGADDLCEVISQEGFWPVLLDGVTGSGKTEVYFEAIAKVLERGQQVLILLPEIALTASFLKRFENRFGAPPGEWHSDIAPKSRERVWRQVVDGQVRVVAGARSALFLPFENLGLIIVDEEHDPAYKQQDRVFYHARDMAVVRAHLANVPIILASATPSLESHVNAEQGRYKRIVLSKRFSDAALPDLVLIDLRKSPPKRGGFISPVVVDAVKETLERKEQALMFLNRRGYAPLTLCRVCGHRFQCPNCSTWLVEHRFRGQIQCHHCGYHERTHESCPDCGTFDHLVACGPGVERIAEEMDQHFPDARVIVLSSDMMGGSKRLRLELDAIAKGEADIIIGTQLVAKGHNFPLMTLVGVVDADLGLSNGDPRAAERTYQLLSQVTGRAGRTGLKSKGFIQTYQPEHPVMRALVSGDPDAFYERETLERERASLPPFGRLASIIISAGNRPEAETHGKALRSAAPTKTAFMVLGPADAPLALVRGRFRMRLLIHGPRGADIQSFIRAMMSAGPKERGSVRVQIDVDPQSFL